MNLIEASQETLCQADRLLQRLDPVHFTAPHAPCFGATVGQHIRHCLDHIEQFLDGVPGGLLDYDSRHRNPDMETLPSVAREQIQSLQSRLECLGPGLDETRSILVKIDCGGPQSCTQNSSIGRELQFLISHTVHHFAIIGIMCNSMNIPVESDFGVAPSTIRHRNSA